MTISLNYLNNLNSQRIEILKEKIKDTHDVESLNKIPQSVPSLYYYAQKRLLELYNKPHKEAEFVTIGNKQNKFINLLVFESDSENIYTTKIKDLLKHKFDVIFEDNDFAGDSYQLALYVAAYALIHDLDIKENLVFSGKLKTDYFYTAYFEKKKTFCTKSNKKLIGGESITIKEVIDQSFKPRRILIWAKNDSNTPAGFKTIALGTLAKRSWVNTIKKTASKILPGDYLAFNSPATFAFGLGAQLGSTYSYTLLNFSNGEYSPITTSRDLKSINDEIDRINIIEDNITDKKINILLYFASHRPTPPSDQQSIIIEAKNTRGFIPFGEYKEFTRQINNAINLLKLKYNFNCINLVFSMPVSMAFLMGWAVGKFLNANIYHYFPDTAQYYKVFNLKELGN